MLICAYIHSRLFMQITNIAMRNDISTMWIKSFAQKKQSYIFVAQMKFNYREFNKAFTGKRFEMIYKSQQDVSMRDLSAKIGISHSTISRFVNGKKLDIDSILKICAWMGKKIGDFVR